MKLKFLATSALVLSAFTFLAQNNVKAMIDPPSGSSGIPKPDLSNIASRVLVFRALYNNHDMAEFFLNNLDTLVGPGYYGESACNAPLLNGCTRQLSCVNINIPGITNHQAFFENSNHVDRYIDMFKNLGYIFSEWIGTTTVDSSSYPNISVNVYR